MSLFVIADTHLSITSGKPMDIFGDRWKDHTQKIQSRWKAIVKDTDTVVIPGDISWSMTLENATEDLRFLSQLPGKKIISKGNHDYWWSSAKKINDAFNLNNIENIQLLFNNSYNIDSVSICGTRGWYNEAASPDGSDYPKIVSRECGRLERSLSDAMEKSPQSEKLVFLHFPPVFDKFVCHEIIDVMKKYDVKRCFFGHIHGKYDIPPAFEYNAISFRLISADYLNFYPYKIF